MKLPEKFKPHLAASTDETRFALCRVAIEGDMAVATNGRILVAGIVAKDGDAGRTWGSVSVSAMKEITKGKSCGPFSGNFSFRSNNVRSMRDFERTVVFREPDAVKFPNWECVIPGSYVGAEYDNTISIAFSATYLKMIADSFGEDKVCLTVKRPHSTQRWNMDPILVTSNHDDRFGVLVPISPRDETNMDPKKNRAFSKAIGEAATRTAKRAEEYQAAVDRQKGKPPTGPDVAARMKAATEWANKHGLDGAALDLLEMFDDARGFLFSEGGAE